MAQQSVEKSAEHLALAMLRQAPPTVAASAVLPAALDTVRAGTPRDVASAIVRAGTISRQQPRGIEERHERDREVRVRDRAGQHKARERRLHDVLEPVAASLRACLFNGTRTPPFPDVSAAAKWMTTHAVTRVGWPRAFLEGYSRAQTTIDELNATDPGTFSRVDTEFLLDLAYWTRLGRTKSSVRVARGTPLGDLRDGVLPLVRVTGLQEADVVAYILTGKRCRADLARIGLRFEQTLDKSGSARRLTINLDVRDVTYTGFREVYHALRRVLGINRRKAPSDRLQRLERLVRAAQARRSRPRRFSRKWWEPVAHQAEYPSWRAAATAYWRTQARRSTRGGAARAE